MKRYRITDAVSEIDDCYLTAYFTQKETNLRRLSAKKKRVRRILPLAACLCLLAACIGILLRPQGIDPIAPGNATMLTAESLASPAVNGTPVKFTGSIPEVLGGKENAGAVTGDAATPFEFSRGYLIVEARVTDELPQIYQELTFYGNSSFVTRRYRVFRMKVQQSYDGVLEGEFFYALPEHLGGDLAQYDSLLLSLSPKGQDYVMLNAETGEIASFSMLFAPPYANAAFGNIIAYTDGVVDESLWQLPGWEVSPSQVEDELTNPEQTAFPARRGSTVEDVFAVLRAEQESWGAWYKLPTLPSYDYTTEEALAVLDYVKPFQNGVFLEYSNWTRELRFHRYIGGCPTNEWIALNRDTEEVTRSEFSFTEEDMTSLPDVAAYLGTLDLAAVTPPHTDMTGKELLYNGAYGWYEKRADGAHSFIKIVWLYADAAEGTSDTFYYDDLFLRLTADGAVPVSREEMETLLGENNGNLSYPDQGYGPIKAPAGIPVPN